jgi:hypothetical protein
MKRQLIETMQSWGNIAKIYKMPQGYAAEVFWENSGKPKISQIFTDSQRCSIWAWLQLIEPIDPKESF